jgi:hypothetical protein
MGPNFEELSAAQSAVIVKWLGDQGLDTKDFQKKLELWLSHIPENLRETVIKILPNFKFYDNDRVGKAWSSRGSLLSYHLKEHGITKSSIRTVIENSHKDSSALVQYVISKTSINSLIAEDSILTVDDVAKLAVEDQYIFLYFNDTIGTGDQFIREIWSKIKTRAKKCIVVALNIAPEGMNKLKNLDSRITLIPNEPTRNTLKQLLADGTIKQEEFDKVTEHGDHLVGAGKGLGYGSCALLLAYHYQCPNNTLPIFWATKNFDDTDRPALFEYKSKKGDSSPQSAVSQARESSSLEK